MYYKLVDQKPKTFIPAFETNDELAQGLKEFASEQRLASASFKAVGALSSVRLGWFNWETKQYEPFSHRRRCAEGRQNGASTLGASSK
jgi:uncharacterized protein